MINQRWVITAAHCTFGRSPGQTRIRIGSHIRNRGGDMHTVAQIRNHPGYNQNTFANDIATVQSNFRIPFNRNTQPIGLASNWHNVVSATVAG